MTRDPVRYRRLMELFDQAVSRSDDARSALLAQVGSEEPALEAELRALLALDGPRDDCFDSIEGRLDAVGLAGVWHGSGDANQGIDAESAGAPGPDPEIGRMIAGRYRLDALLGAGSMGRVYRAFDAGAAREVAIKLLRADLIHDPRHVMRFRREFRAISRLDHPGCVSVFEEGRHQQQHYIAMEYVSGGNLGQLVGARDEVLFPILIQLAAALAYIHGRRIIHRDLKLANVLLAPGDSPVPKLADFGIVRLLDEIDTRLTDTGAILGTIDYLAPEQLEGQAPDPRSDLYALGCVIYSLWADRPPFLGSPYQRLRARVEREAPLLRTVAPHAPEALERLVARLLQRNVAERPQRAGDVARELADHWSRHGGAPVSAQVPGAGPDRAVGEYLYQPGLIGRDAPMATLMANIEAAATGPSSRLVAVHGEAGLGKTMLITDLEQRMARHGGRVIVVHCRSAVLTPFDPFPAVLAALDEALGTSASLHDQDERPRAASESHTGGARHREPRFPADHGVVARRRLARAITGKLLSLHRQAPVLLALEDLHGAATNALALLGELLAQLERIEGRRPVVVATLRPQGRAPLESVLRDRAEIALMVLQPLAPEAVEQIAAAMLAVAAPDLPARLVTHLTRHCGGNPLMVQSALRALVDRGHLHLTSSGWTLESDALAADVTSAAREPVRRRLDALGAPTRAILAAAAVCGPRFDIELVCRATGADHDAVIDAVDEAMRASVVQLVRGRSPYDRYAFEHERMAEILREELAPGQRTRYHDALGTALAERGTASPPTLAFHFSRGSDGARAFHHLREAALWAFDACDYEAAQHYLRDALARVDSLPDEEREAARIECTELLADALIMAGHTRRGIDALRQLPLETAPPVTQARRLRKLGLALLRTTDVGEGLAFLQRALAVLGDVMPRARRRMHVRMLCDVALTAVRRVFRRAPVIDQATEERALIHRELGILYRVIDLERSAAHLAAFIRLAERLGVNAYRIEAHVGAAFLFSLRPWPRLAAGSYERARRLALDSGDMHGLARADIVRGGTAALLGHDEQAAFAHFLEGLRVAERTGDRFLINFALTMRGWGAAFQGRAEQAGEDFERAGALATELDIPWLRDEAAYGQSMVAVVHGHAAFAVSTAHRMLASDMRLALPAFEAFANELLGGAAFVAGRFRDAVGYFERARSHYTAHRLERGWGAMTKMFYGEALLCLVDEQGPQAEPDLVRKLRPMVRWARRQARLPAFRGCDLLLRGVYESRRGNERAARKLFARVWSIRGESARITYVDLWCRARITFERWHLGDARETVCAALDELDDMYRSAGASDMRAWLSRMRDVCGL